MNADTEIRYCSQCGQPKAEGELARFGDNLICAECKPIYTQRLREGGALQTSTRYAGFWIRFVAAMIDGIVLGLGSVAIQAVLLPSMLPTADPSQPGAIALGAIGVAYLIGFVFAVSYEAIFLNRLGATPGKLVLGLKVIRPTGGPISLSRGAARYCGKVLSGIILCIGYIIAAFDREKRALHDMIVDTRVIRTRL